MANADKLTPSKKDMMSVCELRKSIGRGCRNCIYDEVCNGDADSRSKLRKEGIPLKLNPDKQPKSSIRRHNRSKPIRCVETEYVFESRQQVCNMLNITRRQLNKHLELHTPLQVTLTLEEIDDHNKQ